MNSCVILFRDIARGLKDYCEALANHEPFLGFNLVDHPELPAKFWAVGPRLGVLSFVVTNTECPPLTVHPNVVKVRFVVNVPVEGGVQVQIATAQGIAN